jgi:hypothetical protein
VVMFDDIVQVLDLANLDSNAHVFNGLSDG